MFGVNIFIRESKHKRHLYNKREGCQDLEGSKDPLAGLGFGREGAHRKAGNVQGGTRPSKFQEGGSKYLENAKV